MKVKVLEDVHVSQQFGSDKTYKAGTVEVTDKNRDDLDRLVETGLAERVGEGK